MTEISCFYNHFNSKPLKYIFIKYDKYVKVILNYHSVILTIEQLVSNSRLFQMYILSLLCTSTNSITEVYHKTDETIEPEWYDDNRYYINTLDIMYNRHYINSLYIIEDAANTPIYGIYTQKCWKSRSIANYYEFVKLYATNFKKRRNPLKSCEPKRSSSCKKIRKFMKLFDISIDEYIKDPLYLFYLFYKVEQDYLTDYFTKYINQEYKVELLTSILHTYGRDIYNSIKRFI
jgi:hypothetical protein